MMFAGVMKMYRAGYFYLGHNVGQIIVDCVRCLSRPRWSVSGSGQWSGCHPV